MVHTHSITHAAPTPPLSQLMGTWFLLICRDSYYTAICFPFSSCLFAAARSLSCFHALSPARQLNPFPAGLHRRNLVLASVCKPLLSLRTASAANTDHRNNHVHVRVHVRVHSAQCRHNASQRASRELQIKAVTYSERKRGTSSSVEARLVAPLLLLFSLVRVVVDRGYTIWPQERSMDQQ